VVGEYAPAPKITVEEILPRTPTPGDEVTLIIRAEDPNVGIPFLVINGTRVLAFYLEGQPAYLYRFTYRAPTTVLIQAPGGTPITIQIGQLTTTQTTTVTSHDATAAPSGLPVEVVALVAIAVVGAVVLALLARKK